MAQITLQSNEVLNTVDLVESIFPGVDLTPIKNIFTNTTIVGNLTLTKTLKDEIYTLLVSITQ